MEKALSYLKMVQGKFSAKLKIILVVELARLTFKFSIYIVRERPILFIFNRSKKKFILFVLKIIVHFPSISFLFSLNDGSVKFWKINLFGKKLVFFSSLFLRTIHFVPPSCFFSEDWTIPFCTKFCSFSEVLFVQKSNAHFYLLMVSLLLSLWKPAKD